MKKYKVMTRQERLESINKPQTAAHTPTPWKQSGPYIIGQNGLSVTKCTVYKGTNEAKDIENENQAKANAAFICLAVNAHEELVTACQEILVTLKSLADSGWVPEIERLKKALEGAQK